jgi:pyruvate dehydrogenase E2 component (dihydrolipoamide acetyltransferase)
MASEIKLPELGENLEEGEVLDVRVAVGDTVSEGQSLVEIEAEKSTVEVPAPMSGRVTQMLVKRGDKVRVGQTLCMLDPAAKEAPTKSQPKAVKTEQPTETKESASAEVIPSKARPAPAAKTDQATGDGHPTKEVALSPPGDGAGRSVLAGPATRRMARELGVDLSQVPGSARGGRVTPADIQCFVRQLAADVGVRGPSPQAAPLPDFERWGEVERQPLEPVRRKTAEHVSLAWSLVPHVTQHDLADITDLDAFRQQQEASGPKLTVTAFALKAAALALKQFPQFNSSLDAAAGQLIVKKYYHIGVAVDTERGLLVPVIRHVDQKSIHTLAQELADVAERARQKKIGADDLRGGTFTITNLGGIGGTGFSPIVNYPEVAILGLARARQQPVVRDGQIVPRLLLPLSLSYDHRVIDGADAARFTRRMAKLLEQPLLMLLHA